MKGLINLKSRGNLILKDNGSSFPDSPDVGQLCVVDGVLYIYTQIENVISWRPLNSKTQYYKYEQTTPSLTWNIPHNLHTQDLLFQCFSQDNTEIDPSNIQFVDNDNIILSFTEEIAGKVLVFALSDNSSGVTTFFTQYTETVYDNGSVSGSTNINLSNGVIQYLTCTGNTTLTFSNFSANRSQSVVLMIRNGGAHTFTWPSSVKWSGGTAPTLTSSGVDRIVCVSDDGGTTIYSFAAGIDMK